MSFVEGGSYPWMSPELLDFNEGDYRPTKESDVYALGMVIYEVRMCTHVSSEKTQKTGPEQVLCGTIPFGDLAHSIAIVAEIMKGARPERPQDAANLGFTGQLWEIVERCWLVDKNARPPLRAVLSCLKEARGDRW